jgi:hypothetical protein
MSLRKAARHANETPRTDLEIAFKILKFGTRSCDMRFRN